MNKQDILSMSLPEIEGAIKEISQPAYRAKQVWGWLHVKHVQSFGDMANLPQVMRGQLESRYRIATVREEKKLVSKSDGTIKYLHALHDDTLIESVLMEYTHGHSVCVSTQVGCRMGCTFCASAQGGLVRNLTAGEICAQVYGVAQDCKRVGGVVLMGCGEPLDNYDATLRFIELITHPDGVNIGQRHITLSTCGLVPQILALAEQKLQITLAISLHASSDDMRRQLMPIAKAHPLPELMRACRHYVEKTKRRITFEYALAKGVNDSPAIAQDLAKLLRGINCHVNLIPINKTSHSEFMPAVRKDAQNFADILLAKGVQTTIRRSLGGDVDAACGQLRARNIKK